MLTNPLCHALLPVLLVTIALSAQAETSPQEAEFVVRVDLDAFRDTKIGSQLIDAIRSKAAEELDHDGGDPEKAFDHIEEALGFDPFHALHSITVRGRDVTEPLQGIQIVVGMGKSTGNLEGLLLGLPGYESSHHADYLIHSVMAPDMRVYGSIHGDSSQNKQVVIATSQEDVASMLDSLASDSDSPSDIEKRFAKSPDSLIDVYLNQIPNLDDLDGPPKTIAKLLKQISLSIRANGDDLDVTLQLETDNEKHAEQLQQLAQGAVAMVSIAQESDSGKEIAMIAELLDGLDVKRDGQSIELRLAIPENLVIDFLRDEADLPLSR